MVEPTILDAAHIDSNQSQGDTPLDLTRPQKLSFHPEPDQISMSASQRCPRLLAGELKPHSFRSFSQPHMPAPTFAGKGYPS